MPSRLPNPCVDLNYLSIRIDFDDLEENTAALCLLRSCPNLQELEMLVSFVLFTLLGSYSDVHGNILQLLYLINVELQS